MEYRVLYLTIVLSLAVHCFTAPSGRRKEKETKMSCLWSHECAVDECCAGQSSGFFYHRFCKKRPTRGSICNPFAMPGGSSCPCASGLTCALAIIHRNGTEVHRCIPVIELLDEIEGIM